MSQRFSSKGTSINKSKLPAIFRKYSAKHSMTGKTVLDYGCGKYTELPWEHCLRNGAAWYAPYDPYNQPDKQNRAALRLVENGNRFDIAFCSNVLNVIDDDNTVRGIISHLVTLARDVYITVYEGDKTGEGRQTGPDQYQRNEPLRSYLEMIHTMNIAAKSENGMIHIIAE